ncbi:uncharacterized protein AFUA_4G07920 [Aspergillus fumigatus Af293]|uniref:Uncharacterized protein n=2 Tax=Aspergillus fumigatus TaxID=746128 RepID=Q4WP39_ASPFU|nr:hypothetical protein AFUA_4G07920 [Aspergillus fumigatus Af293]EAL89995.1 hypothetical protein AFUA_4G07920 [Aspergillus fumigatus Af293]EDP50171.1 hypothetical protein AFUB_065030 [Aspergillus fumigatus A1163]
MTWPPIPAETVPNIRCDLRIRWRWSRGRSTDAENCEDGKVGEKRLVEAENPQSTYISGEPRWPSPSRLAERGGLNLHDLCTKFCQTIEDLQARE